MTQPIYRSSDGSAPTLGNNNGDLVNVLDKILVDGYGAKTPLGWTIAFTGTNKRVYQMGDGGSNPSTGFQLRVDDSGNVYNAKARGAESFSDVDTISSGGFPTVAQQTDGVYFQKTNNTAGNRAWVAMGDERRFFMLVDCNNDGLSWTGIFFGDFQSFKTGDGYNCMIIGKIVSEASASNDMLGTLSTSMFAASSGHYVARSYSGAGSAINVGKYVDLRHVSGIMGAGAAGSTTTAYPDPISGSLQLARLFLGEQSIGPRGYIPGLWNICHNFPSMAGVANADQFNGSDGLVSRSFELRRLRGNSTDGCCAIELTDWPESV